MQMFYSIKYSFICRHTNPSKNSTTCEDMFTTEVSREFARSRQDLASQSKCRHLAIQTVSK